MTNAKELQEIKIKWQEQQSYSKLSNNDKSNRVTRNYVTTTKVTKLHEIKWQWQQQKSYRKLSNNDKSNKVTWN